MQFMNHRCNSKIKIVQIRKELNLIEYGYNNEMVKPHVAILLGVVKRLNSARNSRKGKITGTLLTFI